MKAYMNLGEDLIAETPRTANDLIKSTVNSVVRNHIANSTIDEIIKNRDQLRNLIMETLKNLCMGWGIWLETVEITDVKILSGNLFRDLQCKYREDQNEEATVHKMAVDQTVNEKREEVNLETNKRNQDNT